MEYDNEDYQHSEIELTKVQKRYIKRMKDGRYILEIKPFILEVFDTAIEAIAALKNIEQQMIDLKIV